MEKIKIYTYCLLVVAIISLSANIVFTAVMVKNASAASDMHVNTKVLAFRNFFTQQVFLSDKVIDFDTRLSLETQVRALNDPQILAQWQAFTNSQTPEEATVQAKALLALLIQKTSN